MIHTFVDDIDSRNRFCTVRHLAVESDGRIWRQLSRRIDNDIKIPEVNFADVMRLQKLPFRTVDGECRTPIVCGTNGRDILTPVAGADCDDCYKCG